MPKLSDIIYMLTIIIVTALLTICAYTKAQYKKELKEVKSELQYKKDKLKICENAVIDYNGGDTITYGGMLQKARNDK